MKKKLAILLAIPFLISLILAGCGEKQPETTENQQQQGGGNETQEQGQQTLYTGYMKINGGEWVEYIYTESKTKCTIECIGIEEVNGKMCYGFETTINCAGKKAILQMWIDKETNERVKYVIKIDNQVYCIDVNNPNIETEPPKTKTPEEHDPSKIPDYETGTYVVPGNGETINVAIFHGTKNAETWVSSEVPFGLVKVIDENGNVVMYLNDFGLTGAHRDITAEERDNCQQLPSIPT